MDRPSAVTGGARNAAQPNGSVAGRHGTRSASQTPSTATTESQPSRNSSATHSVAPSPVESREPSPSRSSRRAASSGKLGGTKSRSSQQDMSPTRPGRSNPTGPTASSQALSSTTIPTLQPPSVVPQIQSPTPQKPSLPSDLRDSPRWPVSPRLRSPPPQLKRPDCATAQDTTAVNLRRPSPTLKPSESQNNSSESDAEDSPQFQSGLRTPARGALETVQEVSLPNSPNAAASGGTALLEQIKDRLSSSHQPPSQPCADNTSRSRSQGPPESGSDSSSPAAEPTRKPPASAPPVVSRQSSAMSTKQTKSKHEASNPSMTVETETVSSIPQVALTTSNKADGGGGTLKAKPSSETIKPKKDKKKTSRKQPPVGSGNGEIPNLAISSAQPRRPHRLSASSFSDTSEGNTLFVGSSGRSSQRDEAGSPRHSVSGSRTKSLVDFPRVSQLLTRYRPASSKADIFEAQIASAVDEAYTSDSEETFVYDSNPPDNAERSVRRFHSRTPSATSMASQADRQNVRSIYGVMESGAGGPKKSMKFVNSYNGGASDNVTTGDEDGKGTGRSTNGSGRGTSRHHHHIGRWGRQPGNGHPSLFDHESPFPHAAKAKMGPTNSRNSSGPPSPRNYASARGHLSSKRSPALVSASYDLDDTTGADDERTPLMASARRNGRHRRVPHNLRQAESQSYPRRSSYLNRFAACLVLTMMLLLVLTGAIGFMFATSQPMTDIDITSITNVVTSEQVLMFDLTLKAHNPNIVVVTVDRANLEIFAKSEYAGADSDWWKSPNGPPDSGLGPLGNPFRGLPGWPGGSDDDEDEDDDDDSKPNVLLGRITEFDSPLTFEGSLFNKGTSESTGEMQLPYPGNKTSGGSRRWEKIYQNEFDLIIKGVIKYSLPLSANVRSATVSGRKTVKPNSANDPSAPNNTMSDTRRIAERRRFMSLPSK